METIQHYILDQDSPIPRKIIAKIHSGEFVDISELLPDRLGCPKSGQAPEDLSTPKSRKRQVYTILEWIQCFGIYIAVLTRKHPERIPALRIRIPVLDHLSAPEI